MTRLNGVTYDEKPVEVVVYPSCVDVLVSHEEVEVEDEMTGETHVKFKCNIERYEVHEYIQKLQKDNANLQEQVTQTQIGMVETYEMLLSLM